jgi:hypothetical protein
MQRLFLDLDDFGIAYAAGGDLVLHVLIAIGWRPCFRRQLDSSKGYNETLLAPSAISFAAGAVSPSPR